MYVLARYSRGTRHLPGSGRFTRCGARVRYVAGALTEVSMWATCLRCRTAVAPPEPFTRCVNRNHLHRWDAGSPDCARSV